MKNILFIASILICFTACIKTQDGALCSNAPAPPALDSSIITLNQSAVLLVSILHPSASLTYQWIGPTGQTAQGSTLDYTYSYYYQSPYGGWKVIAQNGSALCSSDSTSFTVVPNLTSCIGRDSFSIRGYYSYSLFFGGTYFDGNTYYMEFTDGYGDQLDIYYPSLPSQYQIWYTAAEEGDVSGNYCYITFYDANSVSSFYSAGGGNVAIKPNGSGYEISFCNMEMEDDIYDTYDVNGNVVGN